MKKLPATFATRVWDRLVQQGLEANTDLPVAMANQVDLFKASGGGWQMPSAAGESL